jgi:hypothetical protein
VPNAPTPSASPPWSERLTWITITVSMAALDAQPTIDVVPG